MLRLRSRAPRLPGTLLVTLLTALLVAPLAAQDTSGKKRLLIADYQSWRTIQGERISDDGRWAAWTYARVRGDDTLHVRSLDTDVRHLVERASGARFSADGRWLAYYVSPPFTEVEKLERDGETVKRRVGLLELATGETRAWDDASDFVFSPSSTHLFVKKRKADDDAEHDGTDLILRNLVAGYDELIGSVDQAAFDDPGVHLGFTVDAADQDGNGLYVVDLASGARRALDNAEARYARLTWSEEGHALAVLRGETPEGKSHRDNALVAFPDVSADSPTHSVFTASDGLADGWVISEDGALSWNENRTTLFLGTKLQEDELEDWPEEAVPLADVNIWHWADDRIQSEQQQSASRDRSRTYLAAAHTDRGNLVPLADERMREVEVTRDGRWALGRDDSEHVSDWRPQVADYHRIDTGTGERTLVLEAHLRVLGLSPHGDRALYWKDGHVWAYALASDEHTNLTASAGVDFTDAEYDYFGEKPPYGVAAWTADGAGVVLYHEYDVWLQPLDGTAATNLTGGRGAADEIRFRWIRTDPEARTIDLSRPLLLDAYGERTKREGYFELRDGELRELAWEDRRFDVPQKAGDADRYLFTVQSFRDFPDLYVSGRDFAARERITTANPQQDEYLWGSRILFDYTNSDGVPLQGTLAIPDGYEAGQRLPMIVRFYEKYSQDLHLYPTPVYRHSPNFAGYVSNGYLVMQPDVHFRIGSSHSDMLDAVEAAVRKVIEMGYADPERVGLSGHSYSGGGGAFIATRSKMFAAVAHGAAPINLVSEFNQLFVASGRNNHSYDIYGQGRYATDPYTDFDLYWRESPISGVQDMNTPVLYLHGEADGIVNWEQGLEWYNALRFLGKPVIWLSYPDEGHGLSKLQNRIDFQYRLRQFFDHHLKGEPAPPWMTEGVPFLEKGRHAREFAPRIFATDSAGSGGETGR